MSYAKRVDRINDLQQAAAKAKELEAKTLQKTAQAAAQKTAQVSRDILSRVRDLYNNPATKSAIADCITTTIDNQGNVISVIKDSERLAQVAQGLRDEISLAFQGLINKMSASPTMSPIVIQECLSNLTIKGMRLDNQDWQSLEEIRNLLMSSINDSYYPDEPFTYRGNLYPPQVPGPKVLAAREVAVTIFEGFDTLTNEAISKLNDPNSEFSKYVKDRYK
jgi:hypothetical protein